MGLLPVIHNMKLGMGMPVNQSGRNRPSRGINHLFCSPVNLAGNLHNPVFCNGYIPDKRLFAAPVYDPAAFYYHIIHINLPSAGRKRYGLTAVPSSSLL